MVTPIPITGATGTSYFYPETVDAEQWAIAQQGVGERYWVESASAAKVTALGSAARTVRIAAGRIAGGGVVDTILTSVDLELDNPSSGTVYYTVVARRTWQTSDETTITAVAGTSARAIATTLNNTPGVIDDQPLALVAVTKDQNDVVVTDDLRAVGNKGQYEATSELVLQYMNKPGYRVRIAGTEWLRTMGGTWEKVATPLEVTSSFGSSADNWTATSGATTSHLYRDGRRRHLYLELRRDGGGDITPSSTGSIGNVTVFTLSSTGDRPAGDVVTAAAIYQGTSGADYPATVRIDPNNGRVDLCALVGGAPLATQSGSPGNWSLRITADWYVA